VVGRHGRNGLSARKFRTPAARELGLDASGLFQFANRFGLFGFAPWSGFVFGTQQRKGVQ
jgi:hypothetical protein